MSREKPPLDLNIAFMSALENGSMLILNPTNEKQRFVSEDTITMFADSYNVQDDQTDIAKRSFHNVEHPLETSAKAFSAMGKVHQRVKNLIQENQHILSDFTGRDRQLALGAIYRNEVEAAFASKQVRREIATIDQAALAHDVVYHTDKSLHPSVEKYLSAVLEKNAQHNLQWSEQGKADYPMLYDRLSKIESGTGPYALPLINSGAKPNNELLSAIVGAIKTREAGLEADAELINTHVILATIPFRSQEKEDALLTDTASVAKKYLLPQGALEHARKAGLTFTNGADIQAFVMQGPELDATTPRGAKIKVGFAASQHTLTIENNPALRNPKTSIALDHAAVGAAGFNRMMASNIRSGASAVFHGDNDTTIPTLDNKKTVTLQEANSRAAENFIASAEIVEARQVAGFLIAALSGQNAHIPLATLMEDVAMPKLSKIKGASASAEQVTILSNPAATIMLSGKNFPVGDAHIDPLAAQLLLAMGTENIQKMSETISIAMDPEKKLLPADKKIGNLTTQRANLLHKLTAIIGPDNITAIAEALTNKTEKKIEKLSEGKQQEAGAWESRVTQQKTSAQSTAQK